jgi:hypothetical protein
MNHEGIVLLAPLQAISKLKHYGVSGISLESISYSSAFEVFKQNYRHLSSNSKEFELACFERYFALNAAAEFLELESFWLFDTDCWPTDDIRVLEQPLEPCFSSSNSGRTISPHASFFPRGALISFVDFLTSELYQKHIGELTAHFEKLQKSGLPGGVSDMMALSIWLEKRQIQWTNTYNRMTFPLISHNFEEDFRDFRRLSVEAKIDATGHIRTFEISIDQKKFSYANLHFQGRAKWLAYLLARYEKLDGGPKFWAFAIWAGSVQLRIAALSTRFRSKLSRH